MQLLKREFVHKGFLKIKLKINKSENLTPYSSLHLPAQS